MQRSVFHIIVILLLAVLYIGERAVPCVDLHAAAHHPGESRAGLYASFDQAGHSGHHTDDAHDGGSADGSHHCDQCSCPCHIPALSIQGERALSVFYSEREYTPEVYPLPSASVHPPDHVPLA